VTHFAAPVWYAFTIKSMLPRVCGRDTGVYGFIVGFPSTSTFRTTQEATPIPASSPSRGNLSVMRRVSAVSCSERATRSVRNSAGDSTGAGGG
jgi:hypothetical protein